MSWLHWILMFVGAFVTIAVVSLPFCLWLGRRFKSMTTTDPEFCEAKAIEFMADAHNQRKG